MKVDPRISQMEADYGRSALKGEYLAAVYAECME